MNIISMSGGKDSTACALLAIEQGGNNRYVFADTGNEHPYTYEYLDYLESALSITIDRVKADFSAQVIRKREIVRGKWVNDGAVTVEEAEIICESLKPTGNPFLDLCLWKGRFPSSRARFCSQELKQLPLDMYALDLAEKHKITSWQGVRAEESPARAKLEEKERGDFYDIYRPILSWGWDEVFDKHREHGIKPNPLYALGMSRVGCMPCIHSRKSEIKEISQRFPDQIERIAEWERIVASGAKNGKATFFHASTDPVTATKDNDNISTKTHGINSIVEWSKTARGGRQTDIFATDVPVCSSHYGLCE